jgi:hypothetical protein
MLERGVWDPVLENRLTEIAKKHDLRPGIFREVLWHWNRGMNRKAIAAKGVASEQVVGKYIQALKRLSDDDLRTALFCISLQGASLHLSLQATLMLCPEGRPSQ